MSTVGCFQINQQGTPQIVIVIPARMDSQRLPKKAVLPFSGMPMIEHVRRRGILNSHNIPVFVVSGDSQIITTTEEFGGLISFSKRDHSSGTSRVQEFSEQFNFTHFLILQGDEILVIPEQLDSIISSIKNEPEVDFWNMITPLVKSDELENQNIVKCLLSQNSEIFTIFRKSPLTAKISVQMELIYKICGLFALSTKALNLISKRESTPIERSESIEQLKYLELGYKIKSIITDFSYPSVNIPEDVETVTNLLVNDKRQAEMLKKIM